VNLSRAVSVALVILGMFVVAATFVPCYHVTYYDVTAKHTFKVVNYSLFSGFIAVGQINHVGKQQILICYGSDLSTVSVLGKADVVLAILGMIFAVILPVVQVACLLTTWWVPLSLVSHKRLALVQEHMGHWSSMEPYFLAVGVVVYEIGEI
jgi:hypothetical protein